VICYLDTGALVKLYVREARRPVRRKTGRGGPTTSVLLAHRYHMVPYNPAIQFEEKPLIYGQRK